MFKEIQSAAHRLAGVINKIPVLESRILNARVGGSIYLKCENFQRTGAFKLRGAYNAISQLSDAEKAQGVLTYSSGNHAQAVALVGQLLGVKTTIVMPQNAPRTKRAATEGYGAYIIDYDPNKITREELAQEIQSKGGQTLIPPYDHRHIVAGQGTVALELIEEVGELDLLLAPCGGGGLLSGSAIAAKELLPSCKVVGVEPELADDATKSFRTGKLHSVHNPPTIADGTRTPSLGKITFPLVMKYVDDMVTVSEDAITDAVRFLFYTMKLVVEPSGALGIAALLSGKIAAAPCTGVIISGGNIDGDTMRNILRS
ncbi:MAG: threo-3-hydroxy-L-aspartate ammonia-lyase [Candidatus Marinimicrobia bacterium]|nr:threo-3-hydroxy-L-aspartate ammonia-lyase [Candidatus Neomarinimicrobiota bacterium]